jgi:hypothetical protein
VKVVVNGYLRGGEVWSSGFAISGEAGNLATLQDIADAAADYLGTGTGGSGALLDCMDPNSGYTDVTCYSYAPAATSSDKQATSILSAAGTGDGSCSNQTALVATLRTADASRRGRGRMYWPGTGLQLGNTGNVTGPSLQSFADGIAGLLQAAGDDGAPIVISRVGLTANDITTVSVDSRPDVQRGRADKQTVTSRVTSPL